MKKAIVVLGLMLAAGYGAWRWWSSEPAVEVASDASLTQDRIWIDHIPRTDKDVFQLFVVLTQEPVGIFQATSQWKGAYEVFKYEAQGDEIRAVFPQDGAREKIRAKARRCNEHQMDYCLELSGSKRGVKKYYSLEGWVIDGARTVDDVEHRLEAILREAIPRAAK